ncbi:MAG: sugar transferase [Prochlorococcaceae cyanobacterium]|jgi:lipopolysaccharide/colanic/teichoic acid biosynthesis glycosyltransferase
MNRRRPLRLALTDGLLVAASWALYYHWRYGTWPGPSRGPLLVVLFWLLLHYLLGTYADLSGRQLQLGRQLRNDLLAAAGVMLLAVGFTGLSGGSFASTMGRSFLPVVLVLAVAIGQLLRLGQDLAHLWSPQQQWLLIAAPTERDVLARELEQRGCAVPCGIEWRAASGLAPLPAGLPGLLQLDGVAIGGAVVPSAADRQTLLQWQSQGVRLLALSGWCELFLRRLPPELVPERWSSRVEGFGLSRTGPSARLKRLGDLLGTGVLVLLLLPVALGLGLLPLCGQPLRFHSDGCSGRNGRPFRRWRLGAGDPVARPRLERRLQRLGLAALPQLWNVLRGDMSLVGPRPLLVPVQAELLDRFPEAELRCWMRPGMTGWGRLLGPPPEDDDALHWELARDLYYLRHHSLLLDLQVLLQVALTWLGRR